jgi:5-methylcytosine-specific restriction endonuclease McrA
MEKNKCVICSKPTVGKKACSNSCYAKDYRNNNLEKEKARKRAQYWKYKKENYEMVRRINRKATKKYKAKNRELIRQKDKEYNLRTHQATIYHRRIKFGGKWDEVMKRDNYACTTCGVTKDEKRLVIHHKDRTGQLEPHLINNSLDNLVVLCQKCHLAEHRDELYVTRR